MSDAGSSSPPLGTPPAALTRTSVDVQRRLAVGELFAGRYRVLALVGVGGMGMVYRARDEQLGVDVALKVLRPEIAAEPTLRARFRKELLLARQVTHRNVVRIHDLGQDGELQFLTMDFVAGRSLRDVIERDGPLPSERAVEIFRQLAEALAVAHDEGVVHRDLKPANVLLDDTGRAYITDFGIARSLAHSGVTQPGEILGTLEYLSPEQARGEEVDARSDLYALGLVLFEMLSGKLPFRGGSHAEILAQRLHGAPRDLAEVGVEAAPYLRAILRRCLERSPARRYASARQILADLDARRAPARGRMRWLALAGAAAVALALGYSYLRRPAAGPPSEAAPRARLRSVAVLPLHDQTGSADLAWASNGMADMLSAFLAEGPGLRVVDSIRPRRAVEDLGLSSGNLAPSELGRLAGLLDADRVVSGTLRLAGERLRVDLTLTAAEAGAPPVTLHAERPAAALFELVDELGVELRRALAVSPPKVAGAPVTRSAAALAAWSEGRDRLQRGDSLSAVPALERAVAADPEFAAAWVSLAEAYEALGYSEKGRRAAGRGVSAAQGEGSRTGLAARARQALADGEPERAVEILKELLAGYPGDVEARLTLAEASGRVGDIDAALAALREVVEIDPNHPRGWFLLGKYTILSGDPKRAVDDALVHAMAVENRLGSDQGRADVLNAIGVAHQQMGDLAAAEARYREAAALRDRLGDRRGYANSLKNLGTVAMVRGDPTAAAADFSRALALVEAIGDKAGMAEILNAQGGLAEERGCFDQALELYRRALALRRDLGDRRALAQSFGNVGYAYQTLGEYDNAALYWNQALELQVAAGDRAGVVAARQSLGQIELVQGKWRAAQKSFLDTLEESRELGMKDAAAVSAGGLGRVSQLEGRYQAALASYREAQALVRELGDLRGEIEFSLYEAESLAEIGLQAAAEERLAAAEKLLEQADSDEQRADLLSLRGELLLRRGARAQARELFSAARERAARSRSVTAGLRARLGLARSRGAAGASELMALAQEAERLGHAWLRLRALEALARARLDQGEPAGAAEAARAALELAADRGAYARSYLLHLLEARALAARGAGEDAAAARGRALEEIVRLRRDLGAAERQAFDSLPEVRTAEEGARDE